MALGFYFDTESCIACHTCQVACKDAHDLPIHTNYRIVRSFCCGHGPEAKMYHISLSQAGCDLCSDLREIGEQPACVAACPMRCIEFGDVDELKAKHAGERLADGCIAIPNANMDNKSFIMRTKDCMNQPDFAEIII